MAANDTATPKPERQRRYPRGRGSALKLADRAAIQGLALAGLSGADIARRLGRSQRTIGKVLSTAEYQHARDLARSALAQHAEDFADDFVVASKIAALAGRHEPARDALLAIGAIDVPGRHEKTEGITIQIGVAIPGLGPSAQKTTTVATVCARPAISGEIIDA